VILLAPNGILGVWEKISAKRRGFRQVPTVLVENNQENLSSLTLQVQRKLSTGEEE